MLFSITLNGMWLNIDVEEWIWLVWTWWSADGALNRFVAKMFDESEVGVMIFVPKLDCSPVFCGSGVKRVGGRFGSVTSILGFDLLVSFTGCMGARLKLGVVFRSIALKGIWFNNLDGVGISSNL